MLAYLWYVYRPPNYMRPYAQNRIDTAGAIFISLNRWRGDVHGANMRKHNIGEMCIRDRLGRWFTAEIEFSLV